MLPAESATRRPRTVRLMTVAAGLLVLGGVVWLLWQNSQNVGVQPSAPGNDTQDETPAPETAAVYLVRLEDNGESGELIGCGDSLIPIGIDVPSDLTGNLEGSVAFVVAELIERSKPAAEPHYSALSTANLSVDSVAETTNGVTVALSGDFTLGGVCDNPRFEYQLRETIRSVTGEQPLEITIDGVQLNDLVGGQ
jgi:hypothetical protein